MDSIIAWITSPQVRFLVTNMFEQGFLFSFLGLGIQPPMASWGNLLTNAQELIWNAPALVIYPGLTIFITVISFNFLGDGLQDALDPQAMERTD